ncbi:glycoside hydrolase family 127 protein, partial [Planctomycetota bacterium]
MFSCLVLVSLALAAPVDTWEKSSSIPVRAILDPAVSDKTFPVVPTAVEISGLLGERIRAHTVGRIMHIDEDVLLAGFRSRPGSHPWIGEHVGKWLHAASLLWLWSQDDNLREKITRVAKGLIATQGEDGYLGTYVPEKRLGLYPGAAWDGVSWDDSDWDVWVHKYCLIGLLSYYGISGDEEALVACKRAGDLLASTFPQKRSILIAGTHVGMAPTSILEPIVLLYRTTGDKKYLDFALYIVSSWDEPSGPQVLSAMLREKTVLAVGNRKVYEMLSNYVGLCELYRATGKPEFLQAAQYAWKDVSTKRLYITGGSSAGEHFQPDGHLPNDEGAHIQEMCVTTTWTQLCWQLFRLTGREKYAAALEQVLFNETLGAQKPDGSAFSYFMPLEGKKPFRADYPGTRGMDCCNSSGPRALGLATTFLATMDADGFRINTFAPACWHVTITGVPITVTLKSRFPSDGVGTIEIDSQRDVDFPLAIRVPRWTTNPKVSLAGETFQPEPGTYLTINRSWHRGDIVRFSFPFVPNVHVGSGSNEGCMAVTVGPLVLALDQADNPGIKVPKYVTLRGLTAEDCQFEREPAKGNRSWQDETLWACNARDLMAVAKGKEAECRVLLRPFFDAGSWDSSRYAVWLQAPDAVLKSDAIGPFVFLCPQRLVEKNLFEGRSV